MSPARKGKKAGTGAEGAAGDLDPRVTLARPDLAATGLEGRVTADRFAVPRPMTVCVATAPVTSVPSGTAEMTSQLLFGERFDVLEADGLWAWGQCAHDGYVGHVPRSCLDTPEAVGGGVAPTHRVATLSTHVYPEPSVKHRPGAALPMGARLAVGQIRDGFAQLAAGGWVPQTHLAPLDERVDWVAAAEALRGVPYLWGGRSTLGLDCSGLVQIALQAAGRTCPRDSDMQEAALGMGVAAEAELVRGDLVFWTGHVGIMLSPERFLHANIFHMAVAEEPLAEARARIAERGGGAVTRIARLDGSDASA